MNEILNAISTVGFPIVCCGAMGWYVKYITDKNEIRLKDKEQQHIQENELFIECINNNTSALNNNTETIARLCEKLGAA